MQKEKKIQIVLKDPGVLQILDEEIPKRERSNFVEDCMVEYLNLEVAKTLIKSYRKRKSRLLEKGNRKHVEKKSSRKGSDDAEGMMGDFT